MKRREFGMAPGGRMALDRAANRRRNIRYSAMANARQTTVRSGRAREKKGGQG
jgi:hypothetical protein